MSQRFGIGPILASARPLDSASRPDPTVARRLTRSEGPDNDVLPARSGPEGLTLSKFFAFTLASEARPLYPLRGPLASGSNRERRRDSRSDVRSQPDPSEQREFRSARSRRTSDPIRSHPKLLATPPRAGSFLAKDRDFG